MATNLQPPPSRPPRPPFDLRALVLQALAVGAVLSIVLIVVATTITNLAARGIPIGFDFLTARAGFTISETILSFTPDDPNIWAIMVGISNTIFISIVVILVSTLVGTLLGIARLSTNPLVAGLAKCWVEMARNTPLLLLLLFVYTIWWMLPADTGEEIVPGVYASMRGIVVPKPILPGGVGEIIAVLLVAAGLLLLASRAAARIQSNSGKRPPYVPILATILLTVLLIAAIVGGGSIDWPKNRGGQAAGGMALTPETATILFGLIFYTTGFIAEIVRGGINAVPHGQWEASRSLGLSSARTLRLVIIPQMMRVVVPPMTSQYINVVKNSTLALAIGYPDFMVVMGTIINKTSRAIEGTVIIIIAYLAINLCLSAIMNVYNRRVAMRER